MRADLTKGAIVSIDLENAPPVGVAMLLEPGLRCILAPNASPMTYWGTNTYLLGTHQIAVIDPGPDDADHLAAILAAGAGRISHIIVTHAHIDHSPLARQLAAATGAQIYGYGPAHRGRSAVMQHLSAQGLAGGGEGIDGAFDPDVVLDDGAIVSTDEWSLRAIHTPGHIGNHLCLVWGDAVFTGDHIMGWASSLVSPPDGDLTDFMTSCEKLAQIPARIYYAGHGSPVKMPVARLKWLIDHRKSREVQILSALDHGAQTPAQITQTIYHDVMPALMPAATRNVLAHLIDLHERGMVTAYPALSETAQFACIKK